MTHILPEVRYSGPWMQVSFCMLCSTGWGYRSQARGGAEGYICWGFMGIVEAKVAGSSPWAPQGMLGAAEGLRTKGERGWAGEAATRGLAQGGLSGWFRLSAVNPGPTWHL